MRSGRVLAGWISPTEIGYHGGSPPSMDDIVIESDDLNIDRSNQWRSRQSESG